MMIIMNFSSINKICGNKANKDILQIAVQMIILLFNKGIVLISAGGDIGLKKTKEILADERLVVHTGKLEKLREAFHHQVKCYQHFQGQTNKQSSFQNGEFIKSITPAIYYGILYC